MPVIDFHPRPTERLSFEDYLTLTATDRKNIASTRIILPAFGSPIGDSDEAFGELEVILKHPIYAAQFDAAPVFRSAFGKRK